MTVYNPTGSGGGTPGGNNKDIQFNDNGVFGGSDSFIFDKDTIVMSIGDTETGSIGIGTTSPEASLHIVQENATIQMDDGGFTTTLVSSGAGMILTGTDGGPFTEFIQFGLEPGNIDLNAGDIDVNITRASGVGSTPAMVVSNPTGQSLYSGLLFENINPNQTAFAFQTNVSASLNNNWSMGVDGMDNADNNFFLYDQIGGRFVWFVDAPNQHFGVFNPAPQYTLDVGGTGYFNSSLYVNDGFGPQSGSGMIDDDSSGNITGSGTSFTTELKVGDTILVSSNYQQVTAIADDNNMTVAPGIGYSGESFVYSHPLFSVKNFDGEIISQTTFEGTTLVGANAVRKTGFGDGSGSAPNLYIENGLSIGGPLWDNVFSVGPVGSLAASTGGGFLWKSPLTIGIPFIAGSNDLTAQSAAVTNIKTVTVPNDSAMHTYSVGGYLTVTAISVNTVQLQVTYTDETSTSRTVNITGAVATTGINDASPVTIRAKFNTNITIKTVVVGAGSQTYDVGGYITQIN